MHDFILTIKNLVAGMGNYFSAKAISAFTFSLSGLFFGFDNPGILRALLILIIFDFITGIVSAHMAKETIRSKIAVRSAYKIAIYGLLVSAGHLTEQITPGTTFIEEAITTFLALTELISILENAGKMGFAIPRKLLNQLHKLRDEDTVVTQNKTVKVTTDPETQAVSTHTIEEQKVESHKIETPLG